MASRVVMKIPIHGPLPQGRAHFYIPIHGLLAPPIGLVTGDCDLDSFIPMTSSFHKQSFFGGFS